MIDDLIKTNHFKESHNAFFLSLGKAIALAQHFESQCRSFANLLDLKESHMAKGTFVDDESFEKLMNDLTKRLLGRAVVKITRTLQFPEQLTTILNDAKNARNYIAHDASLGILDPFSDDSAVILALHELLNQVRSLIPAHILISGLIFSQNNKEPLRILKNYEQEIIEWTFPA